MSNTVVIVGRPNVGKSTLFNRLIGQRRALVHDLPGVTRDRIEKEVRWTTHGKEVPVVVIDTGGVGGERFSDEIERQVQTAITEADAIVVVFDGVAGLLPADEELIKRLKRSGVTKNIPILGAVNKIDAESHEKLAGEFFSVGLDPILTVSAEHNRGIDDLKTEIVNLAHFTSDANAEAEEPESHAIPQIAVVGRPNVGKSTFVNALLGKERMITSPIAGTTTDAVDTSATLNGKPYLLIDTAGIRRKSKTEKGVEVLSVVQTKKALERADIAVLILDGEQGVSDQDEKIGGMIEEVGCSVILAMNKWDTQRKNRKFTKTMAAERIRGAMAYLKYAPILFMSAKEKRGFDDLGDLISEVMHQRQLKIPTHEFTEWVRQEATVHNPMNAKFYLCHQSGRHPPTFVCHVNDPNKVHFSLKRHLVNALRERWGYMGTPVRLHFVEGKNRRSLPSK